MSEQKRKEEALEFLLAQFPAFYRARTSTYLKSILSALAEGDGFISSQVEAVRDNLIVVTASGKNLDKLASLYGVVRSQGAGIQDEDFKKIVPLLGLSPKQISITLQRIVETIYGPFSSHANVTCSAPAPYHINAQSKLLIRADSETLSVSFQETDAVNLTAATAQEVATAITDRTGGKVIGSVVTNARTGEQFVNLRTATVGSQGFIQIVGGDVQGAMRFPEVRTTRQDIATWQVSNYDGTEEMTYTAVSGVSPGMKSSGVKRGDFVVIREDSGFNLANTGSFEVTYVGEDYFRCINPNGIQEASIEQQNVDDFVFYKPKLGNILLTSRPATVLETGNQELTVLLPVTSPIIKRTLRGGHHFHNGVAVVTGTTSNTISLSSTGDFSSSGAVSVIINRNGTEAICSSVSGSQINLISAEGMPDSGAIYSPVERSFFYYSGKSGSSLTGVVPEPPTSLAGTTLKYSKRYSYTGKTGNTLTGVYPAPSDILGLEVSESGAVSIEAYPGSYLYDPQAAFIPSNALTRLQETLSQGTSKTIVSVEDSSEFPETGYFVIEYGTGDQEGPIKYLGKVGQTVLTVDPGHVFERDHFAGVGLRLVRQLGPYSPRVDGNDLAVYMTSTSLARDLVAQYLKDVVAAGITLKFQVSVPEQKWAVLPQLYASDPLNTELV